MRNTQDWKGPAANMDNYAIVNNPILKNYWRYTILLHHKFPHPSWRKFTPNDKHRFYAGVREELVIPDNVMEKVFWGDRLVPLSSSSLIDWRGKSDQQWENATRVSQYKD